MEVERLTAVLEAAGLGGFQANMAAADRAVAGPKDQMKALAEVSKIATEALQRVKVTAAQAAESRVSAEAIISGVRGISEEARTAARELDHVKLTQAQAAETRLVAAEQVRSLKDVEHQALRTRAATTGGGGGGPGLFGVGRGLLLPAAIGAGALAAPAMGPGALGLLAAIPAFATTGVGALGTLVLGFHGVTKAIGGNLKAFKELEPAQQQFVLTVRSLTGWLHQLKETAGGAMFPGLTQGLKAALSPGTVAAITAAVQDFGHAIGDAGKMWGQYFGSQRFQQTFGPLMASGAAGFRDLSRVALNLTDALLALGKAAIPFTTWLGDVAVKGSAWLDTMIRGKAATGQLAGALDQAKTSLALVGGLVASLGRVLAGLGAALYPVSKVAVKDLTDGLNYLAGVINRNQDKIREIVGGALAALVQTLKILVPIVGALFKGLNNVVEAIGGWKVAFELVIGGFLAAKFVALGRAVYGVATSLGIVGDRAAASAVRFGPLIAALGRVAAYSFASSPDIAGGQSGYVKNVKTGKVERLITRAGHENDPLPAGWVRVAGPGGADVSVTSGAGQHGALKANAAHQAAAAQQARTAYAATHYSRNQIYAMLKAQGATDEEAAYLTYASTTHEDTTGQTNRINDNPGTQDYSVGLFQVNYFGKMLAARTAAFGSPQYLANHPAAQAAAALSILRTQGPGAWPTSAGMASQFFGGNGSPYNPWGPPPPLTGGTQPKKPTPPPLIPAAASTYMQNASTFANLAKQLSNTGAEAKADLVKELVDLTKAWAIIRDKAAQSTGKTRTELDAKRTELENKMRDVGTLISKAIVIAGDALLPAKLKTQLANATAQFKADSAYAQALTGKYADDYAKVLLGDLKGQAADLGAEVNFLKGKLATSSGAQRKAYADELTKIQGELSNVQGQILASLQGAVAIMRQQVTTAFGNVQTELMAQLGAKFYQGGKTPLEQKLADMQAQDQLQGLKDSIQQAQDQLATDQAGALTKVVFDAATGAITNVYSAAGLKQIEADKKALAAAQRQLDEYNLSIDALAERTKMDQQYNEAAKGLNADLAALQVQFENGKGSMSALDAVARKYGLTVSTVATPSMDGLAAASRGLVSAFKDLADFIAHMTGKTPAAVTTPSGGDGATIADHMPTGITNTYRQLVNAGYDQATATYLAKGMNIPLYADGGPTKAGPAILHDGEYVVPKGGALVMAGGGGAGEMIEIRIPIELDGQQITEVVYSGLLRKKKRNGNTLGLA